MKVVNPCKQKTVSCVYTTRMIAGFARIIFFAGI